MTKGSKRASFVAVADRLGEAIRARSIERIDTVFADDIAVWHNHSNSSQTKTENMAVLARLFDFTAGMRYANVRRIITGAGFVEQHDLVFDFSDGRTVALPICMVAAVRDDQIVRLEEYLDPRPLLDALPPGFLHGGDH